MSVRIHRGAREIGGTCIEVASDGKRIVLDAGMPLTTTPPANALLPDVPGMWSPGDGSLLALLLTHTHPDHHGLADLVDTSVPTYLGARAARMRQEASFFMPWWPRLRIAGSLEHGRPLQLGPFIVTPWRVDHSAEDAYAFQVEAGGRMLVYSGDLRGHGREPETLDQLAEAGHDADALLLEGTRVGRSWPDDGSLSETDLEDACAEHFGRAARAVLAFSSGENVDRLSTLHRAARRSGRTLVLDLYAASMWRAAGRPLADVRVLVSNGQRHRVICEQAFDRLDQIRDRRVFPEGLVANPERYVIACRTSAARELESSGVLLDADAVWTMWEGYLAEESMATFTRMLRRNGVAITCLHASGHAHVTDLQRLVEAMRPRRVVPIHTAYPDRYVDYFDDVEVHDDGEWWDV